MLLILLFYFGVPYCHGFHVFVTGDDCGQDLDGCSDKPCSIGRTCIDTNAAAHKADPTLTAFTCGPCPTGFHDDGSKCSG